VSIWSAAGPGCPQDNGAHERLHADIARELQGRPLPERQAIFDTWRQEYNDERPHEAFGQRCPAEYFTPSERTYTSTPQDLDYGPMLTRKVHVTGTIHWEAARIPISSALGGWSVGLEPASCGQWNLWFGKLLLGTIDPSAATFIPNTSTP
jgi:putative transposase